MSKRILKKIVPHKMREAISGLRSAASMHGRMNQLEERLTRVEEQTLSQAREEMWERSRKRWRSARPEAHLTWGREVGGDNFIKKVGSYRAFGPDKAILEIGPGYGRLLRALIAQQAPFGRYLGVDLSSENIKYLNENFAGPEVAFLHGDIEDAALDATFDVVISSLTLKHFFPSFEQALGNVARHMRAGGLCFFDLLEGRASHFEPDGVTYIRLYTKAEVSEILARQGFEVVAFDEVRHDAEHSRLLVVAKKREA